STRSSASWTASDKPSERPCCHQRTSACCCCPSSSVPVNGQGAEKIRSPSCSRTAVAAPASRQARSRSPRPTATRAKPTPERAPGAGHHGAGHIGPLPGGVPQRQPLTQVVVGLTGATLSVSGPTDPCRTTRLLGGCPDETLGVQGLAIATVRRDQVAVGLR